MIKHTLIALASLGAAVGLLLLGKALFPGPAGGPAGQAKSLPKAAPLPLTRRLVVPKMLPPGPKHIASPRAASPATRQPAAPGGIPFPMVPPMPGPLPRPTTATPAPSPHPGPVPAPQPGPVPPLPFPLPGLVPQTPSPRPGTATPAPAPQPGGPQPPLPMPWVFPPLPADLSTPEGAARTFVLACQMRNLEMMSQCVSILAAGDLKAVRDKAASAQAVEQWRVLFQGATVGAAQPASEAGATVEVKLAAGAAPSKKLQMVRENGAWKVLSF